MIAAVPVPVSLTRVRALMARPLDDLTADERAELAAGAVEVRSRLEGLRRRHPEVPVELTPEVEQLLESLSVPTAPAGMSDEEITARLAVLQAEMTALREIRWARNAALAQARRRHRRPRSKCPRGASRGASRGAEACAAHLARVGPPQEAPIGNNAQPLAGRIVGSLKVLGYLRPSLEGEAVSPWWLCVCRRCHAEQAWQGVRLRNTLPACRACGSVA